MKRRDIHVTLPVGELQYIDGIARKRGATRNDVVCEAVTAYRVTSERARIEAEMRAFVEKHGKRSLEITKEFEPHVIEMILRETEW